MNNEFSINMNALNDCLVCLSNAQPYANDIVIAAEILYDQMCKFDDFDSYNTINNIIISSNRCISSKRHIEDIYNTITTLMEYDNNLSVELCHKIMGNEEKFLNEIIRNIYIMNSLNGNNIDFQSMENIIITLIESVNDEDNYYYREYLRRELESSLPQMIAQMQTKNIKLNDNWIYELVDSETSTEKGKSDQNEPLLYVISYFQNNSNEFGKGIIDIIKKYYPNYDDEDVLNTAITLSATACGFSATADCIYDLYEGNEKEFEKVFGFPMVVDNKKTYDYLMTDLYCQATKEGLNKYTMLETMLSLDLTLNKKEMKKYYSPLVSEYIDIKNSNGVGHSNNQIDGTTLYELEDFSSKYIEMEVIVPESNEKFIEDISKELNNGNKIIIASKKTYLEPVDLSILADNSETSFSGLKELVDNSLYEKEPLDIVGGHGMSIDKVIDDEHVLINTWGETYKCNINSLNIMQYGIIKLNEN